jgi:hypothetical protein
MPDRMAHRHGCTSTTRLKPCFRGRRILASAHSNCANIDAEATLRFVRVWTNIRAAASLILFQHRPGDGHYVNQYGCPLILTGYAMRIIGPRTQGDKDILPGFGTLGHGTRERHGVDYLPSRRSVIPMPLLYLMI